MGDRAMHKALKPEAARERCKGVVVQTVALAIVAAAVTFGTLLGLSG